MSNATVLLIALVIVIAVMFAGLWIMWRITGEMAQTRAALHAALVRIRSTDGGTITVLVKADFDDSDFVMKVKAFEREFRRVVASMREEGIQS